MKKKTLLPFGWNQQYATYQIETPRFIDRGGLQIIHADIEAENQENIPLYYEIKDLSKYIEELKVLFINISLEAAAANEEWLDDQRRFLYVTTTLKPAKDGLEQDVIDNKNGARQSNEWFITGFFSLDRRDGHEMIRYLWLHPFLRGNGIVSDFIAWRMKEGPIIADPPISLRGRKCIYKALKKYLLFVATAIHKNQLDASCKEKVIGTLEWYIKYDPKNAKTMQNLLELLKCV